MVCASAAANMAIPCVSAEQAFYLGGRVPLVRNYSLPGTAQPSELESIVRALRETNAVLLRKHGVVVVGKTLEEELMLSQARGFALPLRSSGGPHTHTAAFVPDVTCERIAWHKRHEGTRPSKAYYPIV